MRRVSAGIGHLLFPLMVGNPGDDEGGRGTGAATGAANVAAIARGSMARCERFVRAGHDVFCDEVPAEMMAKAPRLGEGRRGGARRWRVSFALSRRVSLLLHSRSSSIATFPSFQHVLSAKKTTECNNQQGGLIVTADSLSFFSLINKIISLFRVQCHESNTIEPNRRSDTNICTTHILPRTLPRHN